MRVPSSDDGSGLHVYRGHARTAISISEHLQTGSCLFQTQLSADATEDALSIPMAMMMWNESSSVKGKGLRCPIA